MKSRAKADRRMELDPLVKYPYTEDVRIQRLIAKRLGVYEPMASGGGENLLVPPPEGVIKGDSVPAENDRAEFKENLAKAKERRIKSLERQDRLKKEVEVEKKEDL